MGYGEEVNTSDFDSGIRGFDSHYPCSFVYVFAFVGSNPTIATTDDEYMKRRYVGGDFIWKDKKLMEFLLFS